MTVFGSAAGRVDHSNHAGEIFRTVTDGVAYQDAVTWCQHRTRALSPPPDLLSTALDPGGAARSDGTALSPLRSKTAIFTKFCKDQWFCATKEIKRL